MAASSAMAVPGRRYFVDLLFFDRYFVDLLFFDDEGAAFGDPPNQAVLDCIGAAANKGHAAIPVTGTGRSPAYQAAIRQLGDPNSGVAIRLVPEDFEDEAELGNALAALSEFLGLKRSSLDLIVDLGSVADQKPPIITQIHRANLDLIPNIGAWRTLTVTSGAFPLGLAPLTRNIWNRVQRADWQAWLALISGTRRPRRLPSYGDYAIAHPGFLLSCDTRPRTTS